MRMSITSLFARKRRRKRAGKEGRKRGRNNKRRKERKKQLIIQQHRNILSYHGILLPY